MHLEGPWLSTTGKKKTKRKFRNAEEARRARELDDSWNDLMKKYEPKITANKKKSKTLSYKLSIPEGRDTTSHIKSVDSGVGFAAKKESQKYTGTECIGISVLHKSCLQPIFNKQSAEDVAKMRR